MTTSKELQAFKPGVGASQWGRKRKRSQSVNSLDCGRRI